MQGPAPQPARGFTLVEIIVVIVVLGIVAGITTRFFNTSMQTYTGTELRDALSRTGRISIERVNRELRNAVPNTVRVDASGTCVEFLPLVASALYQDQNVTYGTGTASALAPVAPAAAADRFDVFDLAFTPSAGAAYYVLVYPYGPGSGAGDPWQAADPGPLAAFQGFDTAPALPAGVRRVVLAATHRFLRHSPRRRVFIAGGPVSFCVVGNRLLRYSGYALSAAQPVPPPGGQVLAEDIQTADPEIPMGSVFAYSGPTLTRNATVVLDFRFMRPDHLGNAEWVRMSHEVQIRNVP